MAASDPGLNRLLQALQVMLALAVTIGVVYVFMHVTKVLWVDGSGAGSTAATSLAQAAAQHRAITLLAMLLGGLIAMLTAFAVMDPTPREQAVTMALMPVPMLLTMALSIELESHRTVGIVLLAATMGVGTYARKFVPRFGPRAFLYGILLFIGYIFGFLSGGALREDQLGWIAVLLWLAVAVNLLLKVVVSRPLDRGRLNRTSRAFRARCAGVIEAALALFDAVDDRGRKRATRQLHRRLTQLNETALVIDATIAAADQLPPGASAYDAHDELFALELLVQNIGRVTERLAAADLPPQLRAEVRGWLEELRRGRSDRSSSHLEDDDRWEVAGLEERDAVRVHYLATAIVALDDAARDGRQHDQRPDRDGAEAPFESAVTLIFGALPGSALIGTQSAELGGGRGGAMLRRLRLDAPAQVAIRVMIAVGAAAAIGSILSERRYYWAVIAVFITFMGANTSGEQVTKALNRVLGTVGGILVGSLLAHAVGRSSWSILVIIVALGFGVYFIKVSYALMVLGVTVMVSLLYEQLGEYSDQLLVLRLEETAIGAAVATLCALLVFPVHTRRATAVGARGYLTALEDLLAGVARRLRAPHEDARLTSSSRALDHAGQQLVATARPLRRTPFRRDRLEHNLGLFGQTGHQARNLVALVERREPLDPRVAEVVSAALERGRDAVNMLRLCVDEPAAAGPPTRLSLEPLASMDRSLARAGTRPHERARRLLRQVDRLDETIAELHANLDGRRP